MKWDDEEILFSVKCFVSAMLSYYVSLRVGISQPYWAVTTAYLVAQPLVGAVLSKALFRLIGTMIGAGAAVILVPALAGLRLELSAALSLWLAVCIYLGILDRTPRSYTFLLAGFTAALVGFPSLPDPGGIFDTALLRVQEITIGVLASGLIHRLVFPRTVAKRLLEDIDVLLADADRSTRDALNPSAEPSTVGGRRQIAVEIGALDELAVQLPFDTARAVPRARIVRVLQDRLLEILPLGVAIADRMGQLIASGGMPDELKAILPQLSAWLSEGVRSGDRDARAGELLEQLSAICDKLTVGDWRGMLTLNVCTRLGDLVAMHRDAQDLNDQLRGSEGSSVLPRIAELLGRNEDRALHQDRMLALRSAAGAFLAIFCGCAIWIETGWRDGSIAVVNAAICCALFASIDRPGPAVVRFFIGSTTGVVTAIGYVLIVLPHVATFVGVALTIAPPLLLAGVLIARPSLRPPSFGGVVAFLMCVRLDATFAEDVRSTLNIGLSLLVGVAFAAVSTRILQTVGAKESVARLFQAGWRDIADQAEGRVDERHLASRMIDRVGLLIPRLGLIEHRRSDLLSALADMRTGILAGRLRELSGVSTPAEQATARAALEGIGRYFRSLKFEDRDEPPESLLAQIDQSISTFVDDLDPARMRQGIVHLTSLRRNLFPTAPGYQRRA